MSLKNKEELLKQLAELPNSFSWQNEISDFLIKESDVIEKLKIIDTSEIRNEEFNMYTFTNILIFFNKFFIDKNLDESQKLINILEKKFAYFNNENEREFWNSQKAFRYIFEMCKCLVSLMENSLEKANEIFTRALEEVDFEDRHIKAALKGLKADYFIYSEYKDYSKIIDLLEGAIELEPDQHYWHFCLGKILSRRRRITSRYNSGDDEGDKEIKLFEKAFALKKCGIYAAFLAESLVENSNNIYFKNQSSNSLTDNVQQKVNAMNERCLELINEPTNLDNQLENVYIRCATSLIKLRKPYYDPVLAEKFLLKAYELNPNNIMANGKLGEVYQKQHKFDKAKSYLKKAADAGVHQSCFNYFAVQLELGEKNFPEIIQEMKGLIQKYEKDAPLINNIYIQLGWTMYLIEDNLYEAVKYWEHPIKDADKYPNIKNSKFFFHGFSKPLNVLEIVSDEIQIKLQYKDFKDSQGEELYNRILEIFRQKYPQLLNTNPKKRRNTILHGCSNLRKWLKKSQHRSNWKPRNRRHFSTFRNRHSPY